MMVGLLWIVGCYAAGIALVQWMYHRSSRMKRERQTHYVLMTRNNQLHMEWYLRSLYFFSWMKGRSILVTIVDQGSTDDTLNIAKRVSREKDVSIQVETDLSAADCNNEEVVVVNLSGVEDLRKAPLFIQ